MKISASQPQIPSMNTTRCVNEGMPCFCCITVSTSADDRIEATSRCEYNGVSGPTTRADPGILKGGGLGRGSGGSAPGKKFEH